MREDINISGDATTDALRDITNSSNNITRDARTERRLKLLQKRNKTELGIPVLTQSEVVNVQSVVASQPKSTRQSDREKSCSVKNKTRRCEKTDLGIPVVTQSEVVNDQSVGATQSGSIFSHIDQGSSNIYLEEQSSSVKNKRRRWEETECEVHPVDIDSEYTRSQATYCDSQVTYQSTVKERNTGPIFARATNISHSVLTSTAINVDSDSSADSCDDLWDCSSNEGGEVLSDSDTADDINSDVVKRDAQKKFELVSKAEKAFADMLSRLKNQIPAKKQVHLQSAVLILKIKVDVY
ncbi:unnamed protein product [Eruca vesicaria subsp. sativa]|uniref:Uncharacterized protein n=1 Tax=Eruca vesicaria subsp. sativa TaxID=29727 RepID=A0ABC8JSI4_ERUVS|nr:unnamed protein product [Eruca vesicaria subsp. sativa]